jgi:membrane-bound lytic murein transglycosylase D
MTFDTILSKYLEINLLLAISYCVWKSLAWFQKPTTYLKQAYLAMGASMLLPLISFSALFSKGEFKFTPPIQIWSDSEASHGFRRAAESIALTSSNLELGRSSLEGFKLVLLLIILFSSAVVLYRVIQSLNQLQALLKGAHLIKEIGNVQILASDEVKVPFSFSKLTWKSPRPRIQAQIVVPLDLLSNPEAYRIATLHEMQHHRQGDTQWSYLLQALKSVCFWNPFFHLWEKSLSEAQEFACDEALVGLKNVSAHAYGSCLIETAKIGLGSHCVLVGTTGMAVSSSAKSLKRRINKMFTYKKTGAVKKWIGVLGGTAILAVMVTSALASQGLVQDHRISLAEAQKYAQGGDFPITINEAVLAELNYFVGSPERRAFIRNSMARMEPLRQMIEGRIQHYKVPIEMMAVPIIESGYQNLGPNGVGSAGLWSFMPQTARRYDLVVNPQRDDRMNISLETVAAMRYLSDNNRMFNDWQLALLAYNAGERSIQDGIDETGSRDPWVLIDAGYGGENGYLARTIAVAIILKNPSLVN